MTSLQIKRTFEMVTMVALAAGFAVTTFGFFLNEATADNGTGANIGAGLLIFAGVAVGVIGLVAGLVRLSLNFVR